MNEEEKNIVRWLIENENMYDVQTDIDCIKAIKNSIGNYEKDKGIHYIKELITQNNHKFTVLHTDEQSKKTAQKIFFWLRARPYFVDQIDIKNNEIKAISNNTANVLMTKQHLLDKLMVAKNYPRTIELYTTWLPKILKEDGYDVVQSEIDKIVEEKEIEEDNK